MEQLLIRTENKSYLGMAERKDDNKIVGLIDGKFPVRIFPISNEEIYGVQALSGSEGMFYTLKKSDENYVGIAFKGQLGEFHPKNIAEKETTSVTAELKDVLCKYVNNGSSYEKVEIILS